MFGAIDPADDTNSKDVIVTVKGPESKTVLRRKERAFGIWVNSGSAVFNDAPGFYAAFATRPLDEILSPLEQGSSEIGLNNLALKTSRERFSPNIETEWRNALLRNMKNAGLYDSQIGKITMLSDQLFRTDLHLPANVPTGTYTIGFYTVQNQRVVGAQTMPLIVRKSGIGAWIFDFAHRQPLFYGIICVIIAIVAGHASFVAFRRS
jgi:uncharacterized protein (TIGR02186 family)